MIFVT